MITDCNGVRLRVGSRIRIRKIDPVLLDSLDAGEKSDVLSMLDDVLKVREIRGNYVFVEKTWDRGDDCVEIQRFSVICGDVEVVPRL